MPVPFPSATDRGPVAGLTLAEVDNLHATVRTWTQHFPQNLPYIDLMFGFGFGLLGDLIRARRLVEDARQVMEVAVPPPSYLLTGQGITAPLVSNFLFKAFRYRIEQVIAGQPHAGLLSAELLDELNEISRVAGIGPINNPYKLAEYVIARMREISRIREPEENPDPYATLTNHGDPLKRELAELHGEREPNQFAARVRRLLAEGVPNHESEAVRLQMLREVVPLARRAGNEFAAELLALVPVALAELPGPAESTARLDLIRPQADLLGNSFLLAARLNRAAAARALVARFLDLLAGRPGRVRLRLINAVAGPCLRSLQTIGMQDEIGRLVTALRAEVEAVQHLPEVSTKLGDRLEVEAAIRQASLQVAAAWLTLGQDDRAAALLDDAPEVLLSRTGPRLTPKDYTELARTYVAAVGQGPSEMGLPRITELFGKMAQGKITNTWTTAPYYSRLHLQLVEEAVEAVCRMVLEPPVRPTAVVDSGP